MLLGSLYRASMTDFTEISYIIDGNDQIVSVSPEWTRFAVQNDGPELTPENVVGRWLWDFIEDEPTRELYRHVLDRVRSGCATELTLRCDAPGRRRLIEMIVSLRAEGNVEFKTRLLGAKDRPRQPLVAKSTPRNGERVLTCGWCNRVHAGTEEWLEVEEASDRLHLSDEPEQPRAEHVVCPDCFTKVTELLAQKDPLKPVDPGVA